ncbi:MAG TPA: DUF2130 domain-containing protein [Gemmataceae bacterium]|nr:DUF2130 domain-containing protein [Gemmataceae bacterium]
MDTLLCPNCGQAIEVSAVLADQMRKQFEADARRKDAELAERERRLDETVCEQLAVERGRILDEAKTRAEQALGVELGDLRNQLAESAEKLRGAQQAELQMRKERRELEAEKKELELAVTRAIDDERKAIREAAKLEAVEEHRLHDADREHHISELTRQIADLKRKSEQGCQQAQGEVQEAELEETLRRHFPLDVIEPVPVSMHGGDVLQRVRDARGQECGVILWESKRTKSWNEHWLAKLRDDQRLSKAHLAVLLSVELPKGLATFDCVDGVWITGRACLLGVAAALRAGLLEVARTRRALEGRQIKTEQLYAYLSGTEFCRRIEGIVEAVGALRYDLESEKRSHYRMWAKREKQLERAALNTSELHGEIGGILGAALPEVAGLDNVAPPHDAPVETATVDAAPL